MGDDESEMLSSGMPVSCPATKDQEVNEVTFQTQLCAGSFILPISREPVPIEPLIVQFRAAGLTGELRIVDEASGAVVSRFRLDDEPEEGDWRQPVPAA